ncbi:MAG: hypothetical protein L0Y74_11375, partial [candidate division Zixibacteria bacterium]|nr:hypothetical protein [candidate division Zixibacteria bacterium]
QSVAGFKAPIFGVISGSGGEGANRSDGCPGGNGGSSGTVLAIGGNGGNVPNRSGARGGRGGDLWTAWNWLPPFNGASGGNGNPPGKGGCVKTIVTSPGEGGAGNLTREDGQVLGFPESDQEKCGPDGELSGAGLTCEDDSSEQCWTKLGSTFTAFYETSRKKTHPTRTNEWGETRISLSETGRLVEITGQYNDRFKWDIVGTRVTQIRTYDGKGDRDTTEYYTTFINNNRVSSPASEARTPRCINGELYLPFGRASAFYRNEYVYLDGFHYEDTITLRFGGCNPFLIDQVFPNPANWRCCDFVGHKNANYGDCP